jgi:hypothetical protein
MLRGDGKSIAQIARDVQVSPSYVTRILRLGFLSPEILRTILSNRHPIELTAKCLANKIRLPVSWEAQHTLLGIN